MSLFDPEHNAHVQTRAVNGFNRHSFLIDHAWDQIADRLYDIRRSFKTPARLSDRGGEITLPRLCEKEKLVQRPALFPFDLQTGILGAEPESTDCLFSVFDLHRLNDLPSALVQIHHALEQDGVFLAAFPGGRTLNDLQSCLMSAESDLSGRVHPRIHPMIPLETAAQMLLQAGFSLPVADHERITIDYPCLKDLLLDLRGMGETNILNARSRTFAPRRLFDHTEQLYRARFENNIHHTLPVVVDILYLIGWK